MYYYYYYSSCSLNRSSHWRFSVKKVFLKISQILQKTPVSESLFKTRIHCRCLPVKFGKFLRASIFRNICKRLILIKVGLTFLNFNLSKILQLLAFFVSWVSEVYLKPYQSSMMGHVCENTAKQRRQGFRSSVTFLSHALKLVLVITVIDI